MTTTPNENESNRKSASVWAVDWAADCPYCGEVNQGLDDPDWGCSDTHECEKCGLIFDLESPIK